LPSIIAKKTFITAYTDKGVARQRPNPWKRLFTIPSISRLENNYNDQESQEPEHERVGNREQLAYKID
jgi:hypothetical protein